MWLAKLLSGHGASLALGGLVELRPIPARAPLLRRCWGVLYYAKLGKRCLFTRQLKCSGFIALLLGYSTFLLACPPPPCPPPTLPRVWLRACRLVARLAPVWRLLQGLGLLALAWALAAFVTGGRGSMDLMLGSGWSGCNIIRLPLKLQAFRILFVYKYNFLVQWYPVPMHFAEVRKWKVQ